MALFGFQLLPPSINMAERGGRGTGCQKITGKELLSEVCE
ncbi:hypothetical protein CWATWH0402_6470 [Crocosphaera watsonii WH 0402]|uniref:Uncharacterized protein n=1 Tax=Crocosphaera watsonii WH 0402 TaxID=1284629 RepID=T2JVG5_CROWT|nr:hypothetical protein CWATWH0402_6470 [Crocosphaera watsonii WH 0402]